MEFNEIMFKLQTLDESIDELDGDIQHAIDFEDGSHLPMIEMMNAMLKQKAELVEALKGMDEKPSQAVQEWTEAKIVKLLDTMPKNQLHRPLKRLWDRQTADEQDCWGAHHQNGIGFNKHDAKFAGAMVTWWGHKGFFSPKQEKAIRTMLKKYRRQLTEIANEGV